MKAVQGLTNVSLDKFYFMQTITSELVGVPDCRITRCGYTGMSVFCTCKCISIEVFHIAVLYIAHIKVNFFLNLIMSCVYNDNSLPKNH